MAPERAPSQDRGHALFAEPWWLDAVTDGAWEEVTAEGPDGASARLPFVRRRRLGVTLLTQPPLTPTLGPRLAGLPLDPVRRLAVEKRLMTALIEQLPHFDAFQQSFCPALTNWLPFHWAGFEASLRYTYRLPDLSDLDRVWDGVSSNHRRLIRRAAGALEVREAFDVPQLFAITAGTLSGKGLKVPYDLALLTRLDQAASAREARRILVAVDGAGRVHAALLLVWDSDWAYYLLGGRDTEGNPNALRLLQWEAIRFAGALGRGFDFEGSMVKSIERIFSGFGAGQVPYLRVTRRQARAKLLLALGRMRPRRG